MIVWTLFPIVLLLTVGGQCHINPYATLENLYKYNSKNDPGKPLILTDLIETGNLSQAKNLSKVVFPNITIESYAGYFRVNSTEDKSKSSSLFFWFFPAQDNSKTAPVLVWLQGGPGSSSMFGLFQEHGPFMLNTSKSNQTIPYLDIRNITWAKNHNVIYIDNPVGTGFSFAETDDFYSRNQTHVGVNLYLGLKQFFKIFPEFLDNDFYVTGESYAGKYVPALTYTIHINNAVSKMKINLKGMAIGNGFCDPLNMLNYSSYLYNLGLIDHNASRIIQSVEDKARDFILKWKWDEAYDAFDQIIFGDNASLVHNITQFTNYFNYLKPFKDSESDKLMEILFNNTEFRKAIHVGDSTFHTDDKVKKMLKQDVMASVKSWIEILLNSTTPKYNILFYNGQLDIIVAYPLTVSFLDTLNWTGTEKYKTAERSIWYNNDKTDISGFVKKVDNNFYEVLVRNAGHMVPSDQPEWAYDLITKFTSGQL